MKKTAILLSIIISVFFLGASAFGQRKMIDETIKEKNDAQRYEIDVTYPALVERSAQAGKFNNAVKTHITQFVDEFKDMMDGMTDEDRSFLPDGVDYTLDMGYQVEHSDANFISVSFGRSTYTGGAHPNHWTTTLNFDMKSGDVISLESLFKKDSQYLKTISEYSVKDLAKQQEENADSDWIGRGAGPEGENFQSWVITKEGLKFFFDPYQVAPYAAGAFEVTVPYEQFPAAMRSKEFAPLETISYINGNPPNWCRGGHFPSFEGKFAIMKVKGDKTSRAYFYGDDGSCPNGTNCRQKAYVIGGDELLVSRPYGDFFCAWYQPAKGAETVGWIKIKDVRPGYVQEGFQDWTGEWVYGENDLTIASAGGGKLSVKGNAFWKGLGDNIHIGEVDEQGTPSGNTLSLGGSDEYDCRVKLRRLGDYLIVTDNKNCGGVNVSFDGVYRRKK